MKWPFGKQEKGSDPLRAILRRDVSRDSFQLLYAKLLEEKRPGVGLTTIEPFGLSFQGTDGFTYNISLENLWIQCHEEPDEAAEAIESHLEVMAHVGEKLIVDPDAIFPLIKGAEYVAALGDDASKKYALVHLAADLWIGYNLRANGSYSSLSYAELEDTGVTRGSLHELAIKNLDRELPEIDYVEEGEVFVLRGAGERTASLLLVDHVWDWLTAEVLNGESIVAAAPVDHAVLFARASSPSSIAEVRRLARRMFDTLDHTVSPTVLKRSDRSWRSFD